MQATIHVDGIPRCKKSKIDPTLSYKMYKFKEKRILQYTYQFSSPLQKVTVAFDCCHNGINLRC